ncbi:MAG: protein translocase subunit SecF [Oscillospiraceae bacterium]
MRFNFMSKRKVFFLATAIFLSIIALSAIFLGVNMDINFKGGTIITYTYEGEINQGELKSITEDTIGKKVNIKLKKGINGADSFDITLTEAKGLEAEKQTALSTALKESNNTIELAYNNSVDPIIGKEFFIKSMVAVIFAAIVLIVYIGLRFKKISGWSAGVMAVIALLNDIFVVFGVFVIFRMPLDYNFIAVVLTILGYSINDTIVIYDRVRENKRHYPNCGVEELVNISVNESLTRTINTTVSTLIPMIVITIVSLLLGVTSIVSFALPMTIGLISGTYSTIFIAGPLWVEWQLHKQKKTSKK